MDVAWPVDGIENGLACFLHSLLFVFDMATCTIAGNIQPGWLNLADALKALQGHALSTEYDE
jgi:hypothetical protein